MAVATIVLATYNRPSLLTFAVTSVLKQTFQDWVLLVVGDGCDDRTASCLAAFDDSRIFYVNIDSRCGEQSGPNSAGMRAAKTKYVAFLNHDDIWLPFHLETAIRSMEKNQADIYCANAIFTTYAKDKGSYRYAAKTTNPRERLYEHAFYCRPTVFEPVSSWVVRRNSAELVGDWTPAATIVRTPLEDWLLRAWRAGLRAIFSNRVSVLYCNAEKKIWLKKDGEARGKFYDMDASEQAHWSKMLEEKGASKLLSQAKKDIAVIASKTNFFDHRSSGFEDGWVLESLLTPATARIYHKLGWDAFDQVCALLDIQSGQALALMLERRTGETLPSHKSWDQVCSFVSTELACDPNW